MEPMSSIEALGFVYYAGVWLSYETTVPELSKVYDTILDRFNDRPIQEQFPNSKPWEREQLITGICSDKCWNEFLGPEEPE